MAINNIINDHGSKIDRNSVFDCHLLPMGRQMAIENTVSIDFGSRFLDSIQALKVADDKTRDWHERGNL